MNLTPCNLQLPTPLPMERGSRAQRGGGEVKRQHPFRQKQPAEGEAERDHQDQRREDVAVEQDVEQVRRRAAQDQRERRPAVPGQPDDQPDDAHNCAGDGHVGQDHAVDEVEVGDQRVERAGQPDEMVGFLAHELVDQPRQRARLAVDPGSARPRPQVHVGVRDQADQPQGEQDQQFRRTPADQDDQVVPHGENQRRSRHDQRAVMRDGDPADQRQPVNTPLNRRLPEGNRQHQRQEEERHRVDFGDVVVYPHGARQPEEDGHPGGEQRAARQVQREDVDQRQRQDAPEQRNDRRSGRRADAEGAQQHDQRTARHDVERVAGGVQRAPLVEHDLGFAHVDHEIVLGTVGDGLQHRQVGDEQNRQRRAETEQSEGRLIMNHG